MSIDLRTQLKPALSDLRLLEHPFYQRWQNGELKDGELTAYAEQYRHFEAALPSILRSIADGMTDPEARKFVEQNLADETATPSHVELFDGFLGSVDGSPSAPAGPAVAALLDTYSELGSNSATDALAGLVAYELQAPDIAASKGDGLRKHYGLNEQDTKFWDVHVDIDADHGEWGLEALARESTDPERSVAAARSASQAWWNFLDEREAAGTTA